MNLVLYYSPNACSLVPYVTLTEAGATFEVRPLNFRKRQHFAPEYLRLNPRHKVPVLVVHGKPLTENVAIQLWIARAFPQAKLLPTDAWDQAQAVSILAWIASGLHPLLARLNNPAKACDVPGTDANVKQIAQDELFENLAIANDRLAGREFFFDHFTACDAHFYWAFRRATQFALDLAAFPNCRAHFERMERRPSVQKLLAYEASVQAEFAKVA
ncbi:MAG: glutathione S-transferase family protein [Gemmatimonas sp.]